MSLYLIYILQIFSLFILTYATSATEMEITAINDQSAIIPCHAFTSAKRIHGTVTLIRWIHSSFHKPVYTLDLRPLNASISTDASIVNRGRHFPSPESEGRFYLDVSLDPIVLRIDPVSPEDVGLYTCKIDFRNRRSVSSSSKLEVIIPPKEAVVRNSDGQKIEGVIGPYHIGQSVKLSCESLGGRPTPVASWRSNIHDYQRMTINGSMLTIHSLERGDQWSHHTCTVRNTNMAASKSVTVIIELVLSPMELQLYTNIHRPFISGQNVQISCQCFGSYPRAHVTWEKNGKALKAQERITDNGNVTTSFIEFVAKASDDGKEVECMAFNPEIKNLILRRKFVIKVHYKPDVQIAILSNQSRLSEGNNLVLLCNIRANPDPYKSTWMFENKELFNSSSTVIKETTLYIKYLRRSQTGVFKCVSENERGEGSDSVMVTVKHRPVCQETEISYSYGQDEVNVTCNLASNPADVTFHWTLRNSSSNHSWSTGQVSHTRLELQKSSSELHCWGRNEIGVQISPCRILLAESSKGSFFYLHILLLSCFGLLICFIAVFVVVKRYRFKYSLNARSLETEMAHMKGNCGRLISNCAEPSISSTESDCSTNLLTSNKKYSESSITDKPK